MSTNALQIECSKCKVAGTCPRKGASPFLLPRSNKRKLFCHIVGGYGRVPVAKSKLGPESLARSEKDGPCLTIAYVPTWDEETGTVQAEVVKIFSPPIKHPRESVPFNINMFYPANPTKTHGG